MSAWMHGIFHELFRIHGDFHELFTIHRIQHGHAIHAHSTRCAKANNIDSIVHKEVHIVSTYVHKKNKRTHSNAYGKSCCFVLLCNFTLRLVSFLRRVMGSRKNAMQHTNRAAILPLSQLDCESILHLTIPCVSLHYLELHVRAATLNASSCLFDEQNRI